MDSMDTTANLEGWGSDCGYDICVCILKTNRKDDGSYLECMEKSVSDMK